MVSPIWVFLGPLPPPNKKKIGRNNACAQGQQAGKGQAQARAAHRSLGFKRHRPGLGLF